MTDPIRQIEESLTHHERQIQDLSDMVARQWQDIDLLKKTVTVLQQKIAAAAQGAGDTGGDKLSVSEQALRDKPPHY